jgi:SAM-dependent methyltransferase
VYPADVRAASRRFWTPLAVAWRVVSGLGQLGVTRVLDVGSGSGKFCVAAAALAPDVEFVGIEHRPRLVETAREVSSRMQTSNVRFLVGDATLARFDHFDALYLFNPFEENTFDHVEQIDGTVELTFGRYMNDVQRVCTALASARIGTIVVTYHGFGARLPRGYKLLSAEPIGSDRVCFWRKASEYADTRPHTVRRPRASGVWSSASPETSVE